MSKITWHTSAGGSSARAGASGYTGIPEHAWQGEYHIFAPIRRGYGRGSGYSLQWANTGGGTAQHTGLWHDLGEFRSPNAAKRAAQVHASRDR